ncbi:dehydrogenase [Paenibacillus sp. JMULE4]|uniref:dehydrogenase n=1 Tax=Paenibacillus TaxID=44249 RepID=UPI001575181E|nr:dehydrogenase [Paenibacillus sp. JMULE4]NTZ16298.1 dehydrogenase [Paenibacillus sp. JMULE4]
MNPDNKLKHNQPLPSARQIRRTCSRELYRARKRMGGYFAPELIKQADELYYKKVMLNLPFIAEHGSNRKVLADWFDDNVCGEIAVIWNVEPDVLGRAFRESFGG